MVIKYHEAVIDKSGSMNGNLGSLSNVPDMERNKINDWNEQGEADIQKILDEVLSEIDDEMVG